MALLASAALAVWGCKDAPTGPSDGSGLQAYTAPTWAQNQLDSFAVVSDWPMDALSGSGWSILSNGSGTTSIVADASAPHSAPNVSQWLAPGPEMKLDLGGSDPELYTGFWWKASAGWQGSSLLTVTNDYDELSFVSMGVGRLSDGRLALTAFVHADDSDNSGLENSWGTGPNRTLGGNVNGGDFAVTPGSWYHVELYVHFGGIVRWWVNGTPVGDYSGVRLSGLPFAYINLGPTLATTDTVRYDHVYVSKANRNPAAVKDLATTNPTDSTVTLTFTPVDDGTGAPAKTNIRYAAGTISWGSGVDVSNGSCVAPPLGWMVGHQISCQVAGLVPGTAYQFQLVTYRGTLNQNAVFGPLSDVASATTTTSSPNPGAVSDLKVTQTWGNAVALSFTETNDGYGRAAWYDIRYSTAPISWGSATSVQQGTCQTPVAGWGVGSSHFCYVTGLIPGTTYQFQLVAFRGTLNQNAVFGGVSNVVGATTSAAAGPIGSVTNLTARAGNAPGQVFLLFSPTGDGSGQPLDYDIRYGYSPMSWGSASTVSQGTASNAYASCVKFSGYPGPGTATCAIDGLVSGASYQFQVLAYKGTLNQDAQFGGLSNIAGAAPQ